MPGAGAVHHIRLGLPAMFATRLLFLPNARRRKPRTERPTCIFEMVRFARAPDDVPRMKIVSKDQRLKYRRWPEVDQAKSLFNSSLRASLPARLAAAVVPCHFSWRLPAPLPPQLHAQCHPRRRGRLSLAIAQVHQVYELDGRAGPRG